MNQKSTVLETFFSPAKLNLFFRVLRRRQDGYHEIASLFQTVSFGDELQIRLESLGTDQLTCSDPTLACDSSNLILKAVELFRKKTDIDFIFKCHLIKNIPIQSGLGGGSGNAATTLWALRELCGRCVSVAELQRWSIELGSDVPFFFSKGTAFGEGRGEILRERPPVKGQNLWIAKPHFGMPTPLVYSHCNCNELPSIDPLQVLSDIEEGNAVYFNDLEVAAFKIAPELGLLKNKLFELGFSQVVMTGSGSAFFCLGDVEKPTLENITFYKTAFLQREEGLWYEKT